ncbi:hypothetical protein R84B8_02501 [Treponema sp. R8-4-B8]
MKDEQETITIICDNEDCRNKYLLSMDTLRAAAYVTVICKNCGEIQQIRQNEDGGIEISHIR